MTCDTVIKYGDQSVILIISIFAEINQDFEILLDISSLGYKQPNNKRNSAVNKLDYIDFDLLTCQAQIQSTELSFFIRRAPPLYSHSVFSK